MFFEAVIANWLSQGKQPNGLLFRLQGFDKGETGCEVLWGISNVTDATNELSVQIDMYSLMVDVVFTDG